MKRRGFLQMFGAAGLAPALPALPAAAPAVTYNRYMYGLAVFHARTRAHVSAAGIAYRLKVSTATAEAMIAEMASKGMVTPILGKPGTVRAVSNVVDTMRWENATGRARRNPKSNRTQADANKAKSQEQPAAQTWLGHLHNICANEGMTMQPRALQVAA